MMIVYVYFGTSILLWFITIFILTLILFYQKQKPIGRETVLDSLKTDLVIINILGLTYWNFLLFLAYFYNVASSQAYISLKAIVIFHGPEIQELDDLSIKKYSRRFIMCYTFMMIVTDQCMINPNNLILDMLTDSENEPIMGSLFGETFGVFILFWSVIYVKMKSSTKSFSKEAFIACLILISFLLAFSLILNILLPFKDVLGSFTYVSFLTFELLFGIILPCYFIHTTPSLKNFVHKLCFKNKVDII